MSCFNFSDKVLDHFMNPRNVGEMEDADGIGTAGDSECGDSLTFYIKVKNDVISEIRFLVYGCASAIATSSITTELVKDMPLKQAYQLTDQDVIKALDGLPHEKIHCSLLGPSALKNAIDNYYKKSESKAV